MTFPLEEHKGRMGWWLRTAAAEAFVCANPYPRVAEIRRSGEPSLIQSAGGRTFFGVRSCFMEPCFREESGLPNLLPATRTFADERRVCVETDVEPRSMLQLTMNVTIHDRKPELHIEHILRNHAQEARLLAAWALTVFPPEGMALTPWRSDSAGVRSYLLFFDTDPQEACLRATQKVLALDFGTPPVAEHVKVGTNSDAGWAAYVKGDQALVSFVSVEEDATYPEQGSTVTFYNTHGAVDFTDEAFCEIEHVGPLTRVDPGGLVRMQQRLILTGPIRPGIQLDAAGLEHLRAVVER